VRGCAGWALGAYTTHGRNFTIPLTDTTLWTGGAIGLDTLFIFTSETALSVSVDGVFSIGRREIQVLNISNDVPAGGRPLRRSAVLLRVGPLFLFR
jgi:hypothetical protein